MASKYGPDGFDVNALPATVEVLERQTFLTRHDDYFDSIAWAYETHLKETDLGDFDSAILYGNEDSPPRIDFYTLESPTITDTPARVWIAR
jgi:hypothetical protein